MVQQQKLQFIRISFLLAGHTKFSPDLLFSKVAQSYNRSDVFNTDELKDIISPYAKVIVDDGTIVGDWREVLSQNTQSYLGSENFMTLFMSYTLLLQRW